MQIKGKTVLVTGASRGIGAAVAKRFAAGGAVVAIAARSREDLEQVAKEASALSGASPVHVFDCDVSDVSELKRLVSGVQEVVGPIDILINNAGIEQVCDFEEMSLEQIQAIISVNVTGLTLLSRLVAESMVARRSGQIVNVASLAGLTAVPHNAVYSASKHAVVGLSRSLRAELADHNVGVSVVCPGFVEGGMFLTWGRKPPRVAGWVSVEDVVDAILRAAERNKAEIVVSKGLGKITDWFQAVGPDFTISNLRRTGVTGFLRDQAKINAKK